MATAIQFLRTSVESLRPVPTNLSEGMPMVGLHENDPGLYFRLQDDSLMKIGPAVVSDNAPNSSPAGQTGNAVGELWLDTSGATDLLKIWNGTAWVNTNQPATAIPSLDSVLTAGSTSTQSATLGGLTVAGQIFPSTDGSPGQFLRTDGSGNLSWGVPTAVATPGGADTQFQFNDNGTMAGTSLFTVSGTTLQFAGSMVPGTNNSHNIGSNGQRMANVFTTTLDVSDLGADAGTF